MRGGGVCHPDKVHAVYETHIQAHGKRGNALHTLYVLYQLLVLLERQPVIEGQRGTMMEGRGGRGATHCHI